MTERGQRFPCAAAALVGNTLWLAGPSAQRFVEEDAGVFTRTHACVLPRFFRDMAATPEGLWVLRADATRGVGISHLVPLGDGGLDEDWLPTDEFEAARRNFAPLGLAAGNGRVYLTGFRGLVTLEGASRELLPLPDRLRNVLAADESMVWTTDGKDLEVLKVTDAGRTVAAVPELVDGGLVVTGYRTRDAGYGLVSATKTHVYARSNDGAWLQVIDR